MMISKKRANFQKLGVVSLAALIAGCSISPEALTTSDVRKRVQADQFTLFSAQDPIFAPITFEEALARSLKYNMDLRLKLMESAQGRGLAELASYDMLPNLLVSAGYTHRNNVSASKSYRVSNTDGSIIEPTSTDSYSGSQPEHNRTRSAEFTWNALDLGIGYYSAKQKANQVLIAEERRRRVVQNILADVRSAYWRALGAQRLVKQADELIEEVNSALERSRRAEAEGLVPPKQALTYQRLLIDAFDLLASRRTELDLAKRELAALMNVTPGAQFTVAEVDEPLLKPAPLNVAELEELALQQRPELRQEDYNARITADEAKKQLVSLLPNPALSLGLQYDSNKYLYEDDWIQTGASINWNLFKLLSYRTLDDTLEDQKTVDDTRRMALSIAVLTQVRVAIERYKLTLKELDTAEESFLVDQRMAAFAEAAQGSELNAELEVIRAKTRALNSEFKRYGAYAAAQAAFGRIYNSVGFEVIPTGLNQDGALAEVGGAITNYVAEVEDNFFAHADVIPVELPSINLMMNGVSDASKAGLLTAIDALLERNQLETSNDALYMLNMSLNIEPIQRRVRPASWELKLVDAFGTVVDSATYSSTLVANPSDLVIQTFAESAVLANVGQIRGWLANASTK
ncbi:TolC family protein [Marinobacterium sp. LSUCC0821]|uniref:TolC family protein n=1 Tax=Marinobacterium sp. LSUCC0821 TaxID=2668067 RepID=UPI0014525C7A|nr:TolC family protein [Marinobacterium sp. LSUCC0821]QJD71151.1 TolC family protein [Marinobacterium sp. LSUCC0821]